MSLDKAIEYGKEKRRPYYKSQAFDATCRPHGGCPWCERARLIKDKKSRIELEEQLKEIK
jgi:hypothetical protein